MVYTFLSFATMYKKTWFSVIFTVLLFICKVKSQLNGTCITPNNGTATCISVYDCKVFLDVVKAGGGTDSQKKYMKESLCGRYRDVPIVCCGSQSDYLTPSKRNKRDGGIKINPALPDTGCGNSVESNQPGNLVGEHEFPWTARLAYNKTLKFGCEGTLINKRYVLTAGLCINEKVFNQVGNLVKVRLGEHNCASDDNKCDKTNFVEVGIEKIILHKDFGYVNHVNHDDIGLVRLDRDVTFNDEIAPICLPKPNEFAKPGDKVVEIGWYKNSVNKLKAPITVTEKEKCNESYEKYRIKLAETQICAGGFINDTCAGTSGGSLVSKRKTDNLAYILEGIVSFGPSQCGAKGFPNVYTKVEPYLQWIHDNVEN